MCIRDSDPLGTPVELGRHAFIKRGYLSDSHQQDSFDCVDIGTRSLENSLLDERRKHALSPSMLSELSPGSDAVGHSGLSFRPCGHPAIPTCHGRPYWPFSKRCAREDSVTGLTIKSQMIYTSREICLNTDMFAGDAISSSTATAATLSY